ncbi:MAG: DJ-1/PfpI family protein [Defluviitaleaceae bacterium]|nr:DJ-1/PfpI family protein [Defluviitaleaceae bacterium]
MYEALLFLAEGFEEIEAIAPLDILRRGNVKVSSVSLTNNHQVTGSHQITITADKIWDEANPSPGTMLILPGGPGVANYKTHSQLLGLLKSHHQNGGKIAAICGAPTLLGELGLLAGKTATCYPALQGQLKAAEIVNQNVITHGNITTSKSAATSIDFALELLRIIKGSQAAADVAQAIVQKEAIQ